MTIALLIITALVLPLILLYLTLAVNDFEKNTKALASIILKRYHIEPVKKITDATQGMKPMLKLPGKP